MPKAKGEPDQTEPTDEPGRKRPGGGYRPWAELLARTFAVDVLAHPSCRGRMRLLAVIKEPASVARYLAGVGEGVLRRQVLGDDEVCGSHGSGADEVA